MVKSIQELIQLKKSARAVPTRNVPAIDWPRIVDDLQNGKTLVFKTDCKFALPKNTTELADRIRKEGYTGDLKVRRPMAEVVILDPCVVEEVYAPVVERSGRAKTGIVDKYSSHAQLQGDSVTIKRSPGRPPKNPLAGMSNRPQ